MKENTRIYWEYDHHLNRKSVVRRRKHGIFYRILKQTERYHHVVMALVQFDDNGGTSRVPLSELREESTLC